MQITDSTKIKTFDFSVLWDLSGVAPTCKVTNQSVGNDSQATPGNGLVDYTFVISGITEEIHVYNLSAKTDPAQSGNGTNETFDYTLHADFSNLSGLNDQLQVLKAKYGGTWSVTAAGSTLTFKMLQCSANITRLQYYFSSDSLATMYNATNSYVGATIQGLASCKMWFLIYGGTPLVNHSGSLASYDMVGTDAAKSFSDALTQIQGHIPWGGTFQVVGYINDGVKTYGPVTKSVGIGRPGGNSVEDQHNFGGATVQVETLCTQKKLYTEDTTAAALYQGATGTLVSRLYTLVYPPDSTGVVTTTPDSTGAPQVLFPLHEDSDCYQLNFNAVWDYALSTDTTVRIKYRLQKRLNVLCSTSLCNIQCGIQKLEAQIYSAGVPTLQQLTTLSLLASKFARLVGAVVQPDCGVDTAALIKEIQSLGAIPCNCK
jgi:hypothetical protein